MSVLDKISAKFDSIQVGEVTASLVSQLDTYLRPEVKGIFQRYPMENMTSRLIQMGRFSKYTTNEIFHQENGRRNTPVTIEAAAANQSVVDTETGLTIAGCLAITIADADHYDSGAKSNGRVGETVLFSDRSQGQIVAKNTATSNAHVLGIKPNNATLNGAFNAAYATARTGESLVIFTNATSETGRTMTQSAFYGTARVRSFQQIITEGYRSTTRTRQIELYEDINKFEGKTMKYAYDFALEQTEMQFMSRINNAIMLSELSDASAVDRNGELVETTQGVIPTIEARGIDFNISTRPTLDTYHRLASLLKNNYARGKYMVCSGQDYLFGQESFFADYRQGKAIYEDINRNRTVNYTDGTIDGEGGDINFRLNNIHINGYDFGYTFDPILNDPGIAGAAGFDYKKMALFIPMDLVNDSETREARPPLEIRFGDSRLPGQREFFRMWRTGGGSENPTDDSLVGKVNYEAHIAVQMIAANTFAKITITN